MAPNGTGPLLGVDHTAIAVSHSAINAEFFGSVFGFSAGALTENSGPEQDDLDADRDLMTLRGGMPAALVSGPDGHRFLVEQRR
jgi:catechol 2,3-dioxygenase-like lactoylglutathione lyase family enzyme